MLAGLLCAEHHSEKGANAVSVGVQNRKLQELAVQEVQLVDLGRLLCWSIN
jgi:hypothetical protein